MINKDSLLAKIWPKVKKLSPQEGIILTTYKRNRSLTIIRLDETKFLFQEQGYENRKIIVKEAEFKRTIKKILKVEFPRSHKIRIYPLREETFLQDVKKI